MSVGGSIADGLRQFAQCAAWTDGSGPHRFGPGGDNDRCVYCGAPSLAAYARAAKADKDGAN